MEALYFGNANGGLNHGGSGKGPWIMAGAGQLVFNLFATNLNFREVGFPICDSLIARQPPPKMRMTWLSALHCPLQFALCRAKLPRPWIFSLKFATNKIWPRRLSDRTTTRSTACPTTTLAADSPRAGPTTTTNAKKLITPFSGNSRLSGSHASVARPRPRPHPCIPRMALQGRIGRARSALTSTMPAQTSAGHVADRTHYDTRAETREEQSAIWPTTHGRRAVSISLWFLATKTTGWLGRRLRCRRNLTAQGQAGAPTRTSPT